jgi:hypothetical protein
VQRGASDSLNHRSHETHASLVINHLKSRAGNPALMYVYIMYSILPQKRSFSVDA